MPKDENNITREELFDLVWSKPKTKVAADLKISDVAVRKICKKLKIPMPPQGYWLTKHKRERPALPATKGPTVHRIHRRSHSNDTDQVELDPEVAALITFESAPANKIYIQKRLHAPHPAIESTKRKLQKMQPDDYGRVYSYQKNCLDIAVSPANLNRALLIINTLIRALEKRGYAVTTKDQKAQILILGETLSFTIYESSNRQIPILTPKEQLLKDAKPWMFPNFEYVPSGKLTLSIDRHSYGAVQSWRDGTVRRVEDCLNKFVVGLIHAAINKKTARIERQRQKEIWRLQDIERERKRKQIEENRRILELDTEATNWHRSQKIRAYIVAVHDQAIKKFDAIENNSEISKWLEWATDQADRIDPLSER